MLKQFIPKSSFAKNTLVLIAGTAIAQGLAFLVSPILSRLFSPSDFAVFAIFSSSSSVIISAASFRYNLAIPLPKEEDDAKNLIALCLFILLGTSLLSLFFVGGYDFFVIEKSEKFSSWFYLLPLSIASAGTYEIFNYWSTRNKTFKFNAAGRVAISFVTSSISITAGYLKWGPKGLIIGLVLGQLFGSIIMLLTTLLKSKNFFSKVSWPKMKSLAIKYQNFVWVSSPHAIIDTLMDSGIVFLLSYYFFDAVVGWYSFAFRILKAPVGLIGSAFYQVSYQRMSEAKNKGENIQPLIMSMYKKSFLIGLPGFFILFLFTPEIFSFIFSEKWREAGVIAQILIPWLFLNFIVSPVAGVPLIYNKQAHAFLITIADGLIRALALIIGGIYGNYKLSFLIISLSCSGIMLFAMWWYYSLAAPKNESQ